MLKALTRNKLYSVWFILVVALVIAPLFLPSTTTLLLTRILILALFATSLNLEVGYAGMMPIGQAMFLGFGAYAYGILILKAGLPLTEAVILALLLSFVFNLIVGYLCLRGEGMAFGLLHFAFNIQLYSVIDQWVYFTGGSSGLSGIPRPEIFSDTTSFYFFVLAIILICFLLMIIIIRSPLGKVVQGLRENDERLLFLGINTRKFRLVIFVISGMFASLAGILLAMLNTGVFPDYLSPIQSATVLMMILIGGMSSFMGPSIGAAITVIISTEVSNYLNQWQGVLGVIIVACVLIFRGGLLGRRKNKARLSAIVSKIVPVNKSKASPEGMPDK